MNYKMIGAVLTLCLVSFSAGRFFSPASTETKTSEHTATHETVDTNRNQNSVETTKETKLPDGTIIIERRKEKETSTQTESARNAETQKDSSTKTETRPSYMVSVVYEPAVKGFQETNYSGIVERRLFSEVYLGVSFSSSRTAGIVLSLGF
jgi:hypothetical protein